MLMQLMSPGAGHARTGHHLETDRRQEYICASTSRCHGRGFPAETAGAAEGATCPETLRQKDHGSS